MNDIKLAIKSILVADKTYLGFVGNPTAEPYNTHYLEPPDPPAFPQVVFFLKPTKVENDCVDFVIAQPKLSFFIWTQDDGYEDIAKRIIDLLSGRNSTVGFRISYASDGEEGKDEMINAYFTSIYFDIFYRRSRYE